MRLVVLLLSLLVTLSSCGLSPSAQREVNSARNFPRRDFHGKVAPRDIVLKDSDSMSRWAQGCILLAAPGVAVALLLLLAGVGFCAAKLCCRACRKPRPGGYASEAGRYRVGVLVFGVVLVIGVAVGASGVTGINDGRAVLFSSARYGLTETHNLGGYIARNLTAIQKTDADRASAQLSVASLDKGFADASVKVDGAESTVKRYLGYHTSAVAAIYAVVGLAALVACLFGALLRSRGAFWCSVFLGFFAGFLVWIAFGAHLSVRTVVGDSCALLDTFTTNSSSSLTAQFGCSSQSSTAGVSSKSDENMLAVIRNINSELDALPGAPVASRLDERLVTTRSYEALALQVQAVKDSAQANVPAADKSSQNYADLQANLSEAKIIIQIVRDIADLASCRIIITAVDRAQSGLCEKALVGMVRCIAGDGIIGVVIVLSIFLWAKATKRIPKQHAGAADFGAASSGGGGAGYVVMTEQPVYVAPGPQGASAPPYVDPKYNF